MRAPAGADAVTSQVPFGPIDEEPLDSLGPCTTPAMAAGLASEPHTPERIIERIDELTPPPARRGSHRKRVGVP